MTERLPRPLATLRPPRPWSAVNWRELWAFRGLLRALAERDIRVRYKQTLLGVAWAIVQPLAGAGIFSVVFGRIAGLPHGGGSYFLMALIGTSAWTIFAATLQKCSVSLTGNAQLVSKAFFPRLLLPLSTLGSTLVDFAIALALLAATMAIHGVAPAMGMLLLPLWIGGIALFGLGLGLLAAALAVSYRDVQYVLPIAIPFLLYASPVGYDATAVPPDLRTWLYLNPLSALLQGCRASVLGGPMPPMSAIAYSFVGVAAALTVGALIFQRMEQRFADVI